MCKIVISVRYHTPFCKKKPSIFFKNEKNCYFLNKYKKSLRTVLAVA